MKLRCLGSSSSGNCYILTASDSESLVIEAGVDFKEVKKALDFKLRKVVACIVSHEHRDHSKYLPNFLSCGIPVLALAEVFQSFAELRGRVFAKAIVPMHGYQVGGYKIFTLSVRHDVPCLGFIIEHKEMGKLLFITDTMMLEFRLPKLDHIMLEANYSGGRLQENIDNGIMPVSMRDRLLHSHMEIGTACGILRANDLSSVREVVLLHLSARNSSAEQFIAEAEKSAGKPVFVAKNGFQADLSLMPY